MGGGEIFALGILIFAIVLLIKMVTVSGDNDRLLHHLP